MRSAASAGSNGHAIVLGAGIAGLVAARVLADHYERVTLVEQDRLPSGPEPRSGAPQARHLHVLLERGKRTLEALFPGLQEELTAAGAPLVNTTQDTLVLSPRGWAVRCPSELAFRSCSRGLLEWALRRRVAGLGHLRLADGRVAIGLVAAVGGDRVVGARVRPRGDGDEAAAEAIVADLVVDATGRGSRAPHWLGELGYPPPPRTVIDPFLGYASRVYRARPDPARDWLGLYLQGRPPGDLRGGVLMPIEGGRWIVTLGGAGRDYPPVDEAGFLAFARGLRSPLLYEAIRAAEPLTPIAGTRSTANILHHYEALPRWPAGFVVLGDAACAFDPIYGQGMTTAAMGAAVLGACLSEGRAGADGRWECGFQAKLAQSNAAAWSLAAGADALIPGAEGPKPGPEAAAGYRYLDRLTFLATCDPAARVALSEVLALTAPPTALYQPWLVARTLTLPTDLPAEDAPPATVP